jgi:hypothetical protein
MDRKEGFEMDGMEKIFFFFKHSTAFLEAAIFQFLN